MNKTWKAILGVMLIFIFGWLSGALCASLFIRHKALVLLQRPEAVAELLERRMTGNLHLNATQQQQIYADFMENVQQRRELQKQAQPQVQAVNRQTYQQIVAVLNPDQADLFRKNLAELRQRFGKSVFSPNTEISSPPEPLPAAPVTNSGAGSPP